MKSLLILLAMAAVTCSLSLNNIITNRAEASSQPSTRDVVILHAYENGANISGVFRYEGISVYVSSSSANAPTFPQYPDKGVPLAQALSELLSQGFRIEHASDSPIMYTLVR